MFVDDDSVSATSPPPNQPRCFTAAFARIDGCRRDAEKSRMSPNDSDVLHDEEDACVACGDNENVAWSLHADVGTDRSAPLHIDADDLSTRW
jgi:hypothetical protein